LEPVLERIRDEGPLSSKDFEPPPGTKRGTWWDWKPAKVALELLFSRGELMITQRRNFQRVYDLTERVLPADVDVRFPDNAELGRFLVRRALTAYGVATAREMRDHIHGADAQVLEGSLADLVDAGEVVPVRIQGEESGDNFALMTTIESAAELKAPPPRVFLLSPFDNLIIIRKRTLRLFGFDYTLECYLPAAKRKYGYFVLPILWGEDLVGRLDPKADRKLKTLFVRNLYLEPEFDAIDAFLPAFAETLGAFTRFNQCERVELENVPSHKLSGALNDHLQAAGLAG
jgi:uncharacterized protein YcaQ